MPRVDEWGRRLTKRYEALRFVYFENSARYQWMEEWVAEGRALSQRRRRKRAGGKWDRGENSRLARGLRKEGRCRDDR